MPPRTRRQRTAAHGGHRDERRRQRERRRNRDLEDIYFDPAAGGSLQGVDKLLREALRQGKRITRKSIFQWLSKQLAYTLNKPVKKPHRYSRVLVSGIDDQYDADLAYMQAWPDENNGYKYFLLVIDIFSRYVWVRPLYTTSSQSVIDAFSNILATSGRKPRRFRSDKGPEFHAVKTLDFFRNRGIKQMLTQNTPQANYAERAIKTIKSKLRRYMTDRNTRKWIDVLQEVVDSYNNSWHSGIRFVPAQVNAANESKIYWQMYWPKEPYDHRKRHQMRRKVSFAYEVNDLVRISHIKRAFQREYDQRWTGEVFIIRRRFVRDRLPLYELKDWNNDRVQGTYYQSELQKVIIPRDTLFVVDEIVGRRTRRGVREVKVRWLYWPEEHDEWIKESDLVDLPAVGRAGTRV